MQGPDAKTSDPRAHVQQGSAPASGTKTLLVMMPALDEAATIESVIGAIPRVIEGIDRLFFFAGFVFVNALTFGGVFLVLVLAITGVREYLLKRKFHLLALLGGALLLGVVLNELSGIFLEYSHFRALIGASALENPDGFRAFSEPVSYLVTRVENVTEIAFSSHSACWRSCFIRNT